MGLFDNFKKKDAYTATKDFSLLGTRYWTKETSELLKGRNQAEFNAKITNNLQTGYSKYRVMVGKRTVGYLPAEGERFYEANKYNITNAKVTYFMPEDFSDFEARIIFFYK